MLALPVGPSSVAFDINDRAQICGWMGLAPGFTSHAFVWDEGQVTDLGVPPGAVSSQARAISNSRIVCGDIQLPTPKGSFDMFRRGFVYTAGVMKDLGTLPEYMRSIALDVNDAGTVVGYCPSGFGGQFNRAFVWRSGAMSALQDLIPPGTVQRILYATGINQSGQITGTATDFDNNLVGILLTPMPGSVGDVNCDSRINIDDLVLVITQWGPDGPLGSLADLNNDGAVDVQDLIIVITHWSS